ncbi:hypothetical protein K505DRAFT_352113 [Melanomma pulvis-pyrius CBS 109.77]|uniref:Apple domain-containing protein n=1 Tax=Melanomma pulvis-pyrius CBS 109.77 TaxID=1314802 RepID=A0A6A6X243_9PLEO|nr:hypothetical protein K505DRAFT_352113 [Melanomma pulvis-pyrius CBS 109.77]
MFTSTIILTTLAAFTLALPSSISRRAGGPAAVPIPPSCTVTDPVPTATSDETYLPAPAADDALIYNAYYPSPSTNKTALSEQCLQQCYGYGNIGECKTAYWAENVPVPVGYYGSPGGQLETACLFYNRPLQAADFVVAPEGQATDVSVGVIQC